MTETGTAELGSKQLLSRAAHCYREAGLDDDACRCLEGADNYYAAATLHEQAERWESAARCFEKTEQWPRAARCYFLARRPMDSARCHLADDNPLTAAWILAHHAHRFEHARAILTEFTPAGYWQELTLMLAEARCTLPQQPVRAECALHRLFIRLRELGTQPGKVLERDSGSDDDLGNADARAPQEQHAQATPSPNRERNPERDRVMSWAFSLTWRVMDRPDLTMELFVAAWEAGVDTRQRWEDWAGERLGDPSGPEFLWAA
uniref:Tetratricopeptide repeat-containing protein n=1 Tax=Candidatus Kentrum sp. TUN TaxID=2126343 RepID=A0A451A4J4_9GAMM|nr:MAG: hypothetical protein BECKTUN1418D_GA0071000_11395 [Candidatus Kentron sp. TUN]